MKPTRRTFLQFAGFAPAVAIAGAGVSLEAAASTGAQALTRAEFERCLGQAFTFQKSAFEDVPARLAAVEALEGCRDAAEGERKFRLRFEVAGQAGLEEASYRVRHARIANLVIHVRPSAADRQVVEALFNRL